MHSRPVYLHLSSESDYKLFPMLFEPLPPPPVYYHPVKPARVEQPPSEIKSSDVEVKQDQPEQHQPAEINNQEIEIKDDSPPAAAELPQVPSTVSLADSEELPGENHSVAEIHPPVLEITNIRDKEKFFKDIEDSPEPSPLASEDKPPEINRYRLIGKAPVTRGFVMITQDTQEDLRKGGKFCVIL